MRVTGKALSTKIFLKVIDVMRGKRKSWCQSTYLYIYIQIYLCPSPCLFLFKIFSTMTLVSGGETDQGPDLKPVPMLRCFFFPMLLSFCFWSPSSELPFGNLPGISSSVGARRRQSEVRGIIFCGIGSQRLEEGDWLLIDWMMSG